MFVLYFFFRSPEKRFSIQHSETFGNGSWCCIRNEISFRSWIHSQGKDSRFFRDCNVAMLQNHTLLYETYTGNSHDGICFFFVVSKKRFHHLTLILVLKYRLFYVGFSGKKCLGEQRRCL